jgi:hypothetical protein
MGAGSLPVETFCVQYLVMTELVSRRIFGVFYAPVKLTGLFFENQNFQNSIDQGPS